MSGNKIENVEIIALIKRSARDYLSKVKNAWRFNRDKARVEPIPVKGIDCFNEGGD